MTKHKYTAKEEQWLRENYGNGTYTELAVRFSYVFSCHVDGMSIGFCVNELLSIVENTSLMGISYPPAMLKALEVLQKKAGRTDEDAQEHLEEIEEKEEEENKNGSEDL